MLYPTRLPVDQHPFNFKGHLVLKDQFQAKLSKSFGCLGLSKLVLAWMDSVVGEPTLTLASYGLNLAVLGI